MTKVVHCKKKKYDVMIDRSTKFGNPFILINTKDDNERQLVIEKYREWITNGNGKYLLNHLHELKDKTLGCWCSPKPCHGDVLIELRQQQIGEELL